MRLKVLALLAITLPDTSGAQVAARTWEFRGVKLGDIVTREAERRGNWKCDESRETKRLRVCTLFPDSIGVAPVLFSLTVFDGRAAAWRVVFDSRNWQHVLLPLVALYGEPDVTATAVVENGTGGKAQSQIREWRFAEGALRVHERDAERSLDDRLDKGVASITHDALMRAATMVTDSVRRAMGVRSLRGGGQ